jgi:DNA polymerase III subunit delta
VIHLIHGEDDYQVRKAVAGVRSRLAEGDDMLDSNTTVLDGQSLTPAELLAHATAVPFLSNSRLVIVEDLLLALGEVKRARTRKKADEEDPLQAWQKVAKQLGDPAAMPETTTLIFVEGKLSKTNPAFPIFAGIARTVECEPLPKGKIAGWVREVAKEKCVKLASGVAERLAELVGPDLWALDNELQKLAAYAEGGTVEMEAVNELVSAAQDAKMWDLTDSVIAGNARKAATALQRLSAAGEPPQRLLVSIVRPYRQLVLLKDARDRRLSRDETARQSGVPLFKLDEMGALAARYTWPQLRRAYRRILDADLNVKRGLMSDEASLQMLVHELCALAAGARQAAAAGRR